MATRILLYEFVTGGGWWSVDSRQPPSGTLLAEGQAMIRAAAEDFAKISEVEVWTSRDARLAESPFPMRRADEIGDAATELDWLVRTSAAADWTLLIAPETGGALLRRCRLVEAAGGRLLSPPASFVDLAGDKQRTAAWLARQGVPAPRGKLLSEGVEGLTGPLVVKPVDGCGSIGVRFVAAAIALTSDAFATRFGSNQSLRVEEFVPGLAASVAVLCGPGGRFALPPCRQLLSDDGTFTYLGGQLPLPADLANRARRLALAALDALQPAIGYVGVDLVLGEAADGSADRVIEINPRLTTSYVGLRALAEVNLAEAMLAVAGGRPPDLRFCSGPIEFTADGTVSPPGNAP